MASARAGLLPLLLLAAWAVWSWARRIAGPWAGLAAVALFVSLPPVLAHAGLAATDFALAAGFALACEAWSRWLADPSRRHAAWLGVANALALLAKFSALPFLVAAAVVLVVARAAARDAESPMPSARAWRHGALLAVLAGSLTLWAAYRFSIDPLRSPRAEHPPGAAGVMAQWLERDLWPARSLWKGLAAVPQRNAISHKSYFAGEAYRGRRPGFHLAAVALKSPPQFLALLLLVPVAAVLSRRRTWALLAPLAMGAAVLAIPSLGRMDMGLRLVLPVFVPLAVAAGAALATLAARDRRMALVLTATVLSQLAVGWSARPDFLAWFSPFAGREPAHWLVDSDLDWGQDHLRLADTLRARGVDTVHAALTGVPDPQALGLPVVLPLLPGERPIGWIAVSEFALRVGPARAAPESASVYHWLRAEPPVARVGHTLWLWHRERP